MNNLKKIQNLKKNSDWREEIYSFFYILKLFRLTLRNGEKIDDTNVG